MAKVQAFTQALGLQQLWVHEGLSRWNAKPLWPLTDSLSYTVIDQGMSV